MGNVDAVRDLLERGADVASRNEVRIYVRFCYIPLQHCAALVSTALRSFSPVYVPINLCVVAVSFLFASTNGWRRRRRTGTKTILTQYGDTALILVTEIGDVDCLRLLVEAGAEVGAANHVRGVAFCQK
jgi:ankyrin repeat protein